MNRKVLVFNTFALLVCSVLFAHANKGGGTGKAAEPEVPSKYSATRLSVNEGHYKDSGYAVGDNYDTYSSKDYKNNNNYGTSEYKVGESSEESEEKDTMLASLDVWISSADDWEHDGPDYRKKGKYNKGSSSSGYSNSDSKKNSRSKRSYSRVRFPVRQFPNIRSFPLKRFPPLISIFPWLPIFYDKLTYQTFIFSPTGGIYVLPPLINFYGQRFAVAQLIKWGYASLVSTGVPPPPNVNVAPLVQPVPAGGAITTGVVGSETARQAPTYDSRHARFTDGVKTDFPPFRPRYPSTIYEAGSRYFSQSYSQDQVSGGNYARPPPQDAYAQGA